jgi:hypothetical protein
VRGALEQSVQRDDQRIVGADVLDVEPLLLEHPSQRALIEVHEVLGSVTEPESAKDPPAHASMVGSREVQQTARTQSLAHSTER